MTIERVRVLIQQHIEKMETVEERGLDEATDRGILRAQMALGGKRALEDLGRHINSEILAKQLNLPMTFIDRKRAASMEAEEAAPRKSRVA